MYPWNEIMCGNMPVFNLQKYNVSHAHLLQHCWFFEIFFSLTRMISNSLFVFNGLSSEIWAGNFRYFNDKLLAFPHTEKNFVLLLMVPDKLVPKHSVHECVLWIDNDLKIPCFQGPSILNFLFQDLLQTLYVQPFNLSL